MSSPRWMRRLGVGCISEHPTWLSSISTSVPLPLTFQVWCVLCGFVSLTDWTFPLFVMLKQLIVSYSHTESKETQRQ